jgi:uncharacterized SAM-binding protein YcdF (DUF218 family)
VPQRKSLLRLLAVLVALAAILILTHAWWLPGLAYALVRFDAPQPADAVVVLGGDGFGHRILKAAELVRNRYAPLVLVSGPEGFYGYNEAELAIAYAERAGYPASWFVAVPHPYSSTSGEARVFAPELRRRGIRACLLVTSDYHTRRAGRIFRAAIPEVRFFVVAAPYPNFDPASWWQTREGRKLVFLEWQKTIASWFGL